MADEQIRQLLARTDGSTRAITVPKPGGYDALMLTERSSPTESANIRISGLDVEDCVVVAVKWAGVNYADVCVRWGLYESANKLVGFPIVPGFEFSGVVETVGSRLLKDFRVGDEVFGVTLFGAYSDRIRVPSRQLFRMPGPSILRPSMAAALPTVALTAWYALHVVAGPPAPGMCILVHSAAGGVGSMLVQMGRIAGLKVVGVVGNASKVAFARSIGCDAVVDKSSEALWPAAEAAARSLDPGAGGRFGAVFDANGYTTLRAGYERLAPGGRLVVYGFHSMLPRTGGRLGVREWLRMALGWLRTPRFDPLKMTASNRGIIGFNLSFLFDRIDLLERAMESIIKWTEDGRLRVAKVTSFALADVAHAHRAIESGLTVGKLVLRMDNSDD